MTPHLGFLAQALYGVVEHADEILHVELAEGGAAHWGHVNLGLFELDHRAPRVCELGEFLVESVAQRHHPLDLVGVVGVLDRGRQNFRHDGAEFDRSSGQSLGGLPHGGVLQIAATHGADDLGDHIGFEIVVQHMAHGEANAAEFVGRGTWHAFFEPVHVEGRVARPAAPADLIVVMGVAVGQDVEPGGLLVFYVDPDRIGVLLAEPCIDHGLQERALAQSFGEPIGPRQGADKRRWHDDVGGRAIHECLPLGIRLCRRVKA